MVLILFCLFVVNLEKKYILESLYISTLSVSFFFFGANEIVEEKKWSEL